MPKNPWDSIIGMFKDDPIFEEVDRRIKQDRERELKRLKNKCEVGLRKSSKKKSSTD